MSLATIEASCKERQENYERLKKERQLELARVSRGIKQQVSEDEVELDIVEIIDNIEDSEGEVVEVAEEQGEPEIDENAEELAKALAAEKAANEAKERTKAKVKRKLEAKISRSKSRTSQYPQRISVATDGVIIEEEVITEEIARERKSLAALKQNQTYVEMQDAKAKADDGRSSRYSVRRKSRPSSVYDSEEISFEEEEDFFDEEGEEMLSGDYQDLTSDHVYSESSSSHGAQVAKNANFNF